MTKRSFLDLGVRARPLFAGAYLTVQAALLVTAGLRPDGAFSFRMFNESSVITIKLGRRIAGPYGTAVVVPTDGSWEARGRDGAARRFRWADRVQDTTLAALGRPVHASYGVDAQLFRLQAALDDVVRHIGEDGETRALVADVEVRRNGRPPYVTRLESPREP